MSSSAVLVHSICTILSNFGETLAFAELATSGLLERQFQLHPLCHRVLRKPEVLFDKQAYADTSSLMEETARAAAADWVICTQPLPHYGIEVFITHRGLFVTRYRIIHPPHLPVNWPAWTACYEIIERFSIYLSSGQTGSANSDDSNDIS